MNEPPMARVKASLAATLAGMVVILLSISVPIVYGMFPGASKIFSGDTTEVVILSLLLSVFVMIFGAPNLRSTQGERGKLSSSSRNNASPASRAAGLWPGIVLIIGLMFVDYVIFFYLLILSAISILVITQG
jgi:hypothetical protein